MQNNRTVFTFEFNDKGKVKVNNLTKGFVELETAMKKVTAESARQAASSSKANAALGNTISNAGLAGAVLTETGRTISDFNYGIRGVANNLSQLSTLLITFIGKQEQSGLKGVVSAFKGLGQQLMGPMGIIIAFQIFITVLESFSLKSDKAKGSVDAFNASLTKNQQLLSDTNILLQTKNLSLSERSDITAAVSSEEKDLDKAIKARNLSDEDANALTSKFLVLKQQELELKEKAKKQAEEIKETGITQAQLEEDRNKVLTKLNQLQKKILLTPLTNAPQIAALKQEKVQLNERLSQYDSSADKLSELTKTLAAYGLKQKEITALLEVDTKKRQENIKAFEAISIEDYTRILGDALGRDVSFTSLFGDPYAEEEYDKFLKGLDENLPDFIDDIDEYVDNQLLTAGRVSLTEKLLGLEEASVEKDLRALKAKYDPILYETEEFLKLEEAIRKKYSDKKEIEQEKNDKAESQARFDHWNELAKGFAGFMNNIALLNEGNKDLARASIIASAAATSIGIWEAWFVDDKVSPPPIKLAGAIATQAALVASTAAALKSLNTNTPIGGAGSAATGSSASPQFNVVGQEVGQMGQLASAITGQTGEPIRAYVVLDDVNSAAELDNKITTSGSIG